MRGLQAYLAGPRSVAAPVGAAISRQEGTSPERFGPKALFRKVGGRYQVRPGTAPHPSRRCRATLSQERVFSLTRPGLRPVHLPRRGRRPPAGAVPYLPLGEGADLRRKRGGTKLVLRTTPHPSGLRPATLSQERIFPSSVPGWAWSTFPVGEGYLRRGHSLTFPWGKVPPQRRKRGGTKSVLRTAPHPSRLRRATLSQERFFSSPVRASPSHPLVRRGFFENSLFSPKTEELF